MTKDIPYDGLGGQAGLREHIAKCRDLYVPPSQKIDRRERLPRKAVEMLDECLRDGLALDADQRFPTRQAWLTAWDELHFALRKGERLSPLERAFVNGIESVTKLFRRT